MVIGDALLALNVNPQEKTSLANIINKLDDDLVKKLLTQMLPRSEESFITFGREFFCFSSTFLKNLLEDQATKSGAFSISFE